MRFKNHAGFTIVELAVTIAVISILIGVTSYGVGNALAKSRDEERRTDALNLALHLDSAYISGFSGLGGLRGSYPSTQHISTSGVETAFRGLDVKNLRAPRTSTTGTSIIIASNGNQAPTDVRPTPTIDTYIYQPLNASGELCSATTQECRKFNLFYLLETEPGVQKITSKNQ